jgi:hypothetical protein
MQDQYVSFSAAWFTLSLINAGLAQSKGRRGLPWWLGSLFIGPFATLIIVAWPAVQPGEPAPEVMGRTQATIVGALAILAIIAIAGLISFFASGSAR